MPEYPDITVYIEALRNRITGQTLEAFKLASPFLLRTATPPLDALIGRQARSVERIGKRIAIEFDGAVWMVFHLMVAGRLHWKQPGQKAPGKNALLSLSFSNGLLYLTEAGTKKRASLHIVEGSRGVQALNPGGLEVLECDLTAFSAALTGANHTLKRSLTDPHVFSGIGNAYSDEILHRAGLSPIVMTQKLTAEEIDRLFHAVRDTLQLWTDRLRRECGAGFPEKVTAFREDMAVHGRYGQPCPVCNTPVQRIRYAANETNYCPTCQTGGKILADRALSRLLKKDWPRSVDELERLKPL